MSKRILITSTDLMMIQFLVPYVRHLSENGFEVEIACSQVGGRMDEVRSALGACVKDIHVVRLVRSPVSPRNLLGFGDMIKMIQPGKYDIIWTNEPVMGVVTRLAARKARKAGTKVLYMVHGFHFFAGAGKLNWMLYYPVERLCSHACDAIVTMNEEDYRRAGEFRAAKVYKIQGVGVDNSKFQAVKDMTDEMRQTKRRELGIPDGSYFLLSVGELSKRKNHAVVLRALARLGDSDLHFAICGKGDQQPRLEQLARELGIEDRVHFLGYRKDIPQVCKAADCFVFSTLQEGLPFALMEAMEAGLPVIASRVRGNTDLIVEGKGGLLCDPRSPEDYAGAIEKIRTMDVNEMIAFNRTRVVEFDKDHAKQNVQSVLMDILN